MAQSQDGVDLIVGQTCIIRARLEAWFERSDEIKTRKYTSVILIFQKGNCSKVLLTLRRSNGRKVGIISLVAD